MYIGEMCRYVMCTSSSSHDQQHKVRYLNIKIVLVVLLKQWKCVGVEEHVELLERDRQMK